jgi:DNA-binding ferritin-like protein (Dps family)
MSQDARIATHEIQFSPGGTAIGVEVGRDCSKVVPISQLRMDKTKTAAKRSLGFLGPKKSKGSVNVLGAEAEAKMAERKLQREKLRALRERNVPMDVMEEDENDGTASSKEGKGKSPRRAALGSLDSNSPVISWTEQLAEELESAKEPQASPAKQRPIGCSQSPLSSPKISGKGGTLEERYGGTEPLRPVSMGIPIKASPAAKKKKSKKRGFGFGRTNRRGESMSDDDAHGAALAVEALQSKDPLRQSFLLRTIEQQQDELRRTNEAAAQRMALLEQQYQAQMEENTRKMEEEAKKAAAAAAAELAQEVLGPMAAKAAAAQETVTDTAGQGIENYADPDWLEKYMGTATPQQMDAYAATAPAKLACQHILFQLTRFFCSLAVTYQQI